MVYLLGVVVSVAALSFFAERFVHSSSAIATLFKVSPLAVGVVFMGFGTSLPEMLVSVQAAIRGSGELALGNIVGSNVVNMTIVLGVGAIITTLFVSGRVVKREAPFAVVGSALYAVAVMVAANYRILAAVALLLFGAFALWEQLHQGTKSDSGDAFLEEVEEEMLLLDGASKPRLMFFSVLFLVGLVASAQGLVFSAEGFADYINLSPLVTGVVLLAFGTSLPELASVVVAARKKEHDLVVGNLWGSTLFNAVFVGGASLLAGAAPVVSWWVVALPVGVAVVAWLMTSHQLSVRRWEGVLLILLGVASVLVLVLAQ